MSDGIQGYAYGSRYRPSWPTTLRALLYIVIGRRRSLARDAFYALRDAPRPPLVRGEDRIPASGPFVVCANHYERPGLWMAWPAVLVSGLVLLRAGSDIRWIAIQEWESFRLWGIPVPPVVTRIVFERAFRVYGLVAMPPPGAPAGERAAALRAAARVTRDSGIIGIMPEGTVGPTPELLDAREGVGGFIQLLTAGGARVLPIGIYEEDGRLVINIGEPFAPQPARSVSREEADLQVRTQVMEAVRDLLPAALWGAYRYVSSPFKAAPRRT